MAMANAYLRFGLKQLHSKGPDVEIWCFDTISCHQFGSEIVTPERPTDIPQVDESSQCQNPVLHDLHSLHIASIVYFIW